MALQRLCPGADLVFACARREALAVLPLSAVSGLRERVGHEAVDSTYRYARLFPTKQGEMAAALDRARG